MRSCLCGKGESPVTNYIDTRLLIFRAKNQWLSADWQLLWRCYKVKKEDTGEAIKLQNTATSRVPVLCVGIEDGTTVHLEALSERLGFIDTSNTIWVTSLSLIPPTHIPEHCLLNNLLPFSRYIHTSSAPY